MLSTQIRMIINSYTQETIKHGIKTVKIRPCFSEYSFKSLFENMINRFTDKFSFDLITLGTAENQTQLYNLFIEYENIKEPILVLQQDSVIYFISKQTRPRFDQTLLPFLANLYPKLIRIFLKSKQIYELIKNMAATSYTDFIVTRAVANRLYGQTATDIRYQQMTFEQAFNHALKEHLFIDSIQVSTKEHPILKFSISRDGIISLVQGESFFDFFHIITKVGEIGKELVSIASKRSRKETKDHRPLPIKITFETDIFKEVRNRKELIKKIDNYHHCNYAVIHSGNPHIYISIIDRIDGSAFSVRTYGENALLLIPKITASSASLIRFSQFLTESFCEGEMKELKEKVGGKRIGRE